MTEITSNQEDKSGVLQKHDFVVVEYTGKLPEGKIFDTTNEKIAREAGIFSQKMKYESAEICIGEQQVLPGLDRALIGKEVGKKYIVTLAPEHAFGKRDVKKIKMVPTATFMEHKVQPFPGLQIDVDGEIGTVLRVAGGRILVNFNHPLAGKEVVYEVEVKRKITEPKEQVTAFVHRVFGVPEEQITVELADEGEKEKKVVLTLPFDFPVQLSDAFAKKLAELVKVKTVEFRKK
ncbi:peptidylprolyl isomerase [Candidatus Woesearchaeota archaeon]|nr:peptidylprolyl isomerase [Candidatus Woesearchaeota archaeon]